VEAWEAFLNGGPPGSELMSRYIFEHLFIASLYFDEEGDAASTYTPGALAYAEWRTDRRDCHPPALR
jgi:hypothetical protein